MADGYFICPHCGAEVPAGAAACPQCGSDEETGWSEAASYQNLLLYEEEPDDEPPPSFPWTTLFMATVALGLVAALLVSRSVWGLYLFGFLLIVIAVAYYLRNVRPQSRSAREQELYADLLRKARGDASLVERWIAYERRRNPDAEWVELMQDARYRWERDNR